MIEIVDSEAKHIPLLIKDIRPDDEIEIQRLGIEPRKALFKSYRRAVYRKTAFVDNRVLAMWGVCGTPLGVVGIPYLITSKHIHDIPRVTFCRVYLEEVSVMKSLFLELENYVDVNYSGAIKMLKIAGFDIDGPFMINNHPFYKFKLEVE